MFLQLYRRILVPTVVIRNMEALAIVFVLRAPVEIPILIRFMVLQGVGVMPRVIVSKASGLEHKVAPTRVLNVTGPQRPHLIRAEVDLRRRIHPHLLPHPHLFPYALLLIAVRALR